MDSGKNGTSFHETGSFSKRELQTDQYRKIRGRCWRLMQLLQMKIESTE
jgi:hypothetical protein